MKDFLIPKYANIPGRGLMNNVSYRQRLEFLRKLPNDLEVVITTCLNPDELKNNIESFIGSVEIPMALVGPLINVKEDESREELFGIIGTTEGALVASMNRGAKAINDSGGFSSKVLYQKMLRSPMFTFKNLYEALKFEEWIKINFNKIKKITENYSNYAELLEIKPLVIGKITHLKFVFSTGDASGQNMTTNCTWQACLWIESNFNEHHSFQILNFVIDGNGASDKKVSFASMQSGRGVHVICECYLTNGSIIKNLRTTADEMFQSYIHSMAISRVDGMIGYNINVANAIAGFFASTAQDLASIHESSIGILQLEKTKEGLYVSLSLPNLVIGTVGGGTHLQAQNAILKFMKSEGKGGVNRLAQIIAGFALSLEMSTLAAIVSGQFARAHQKLGRNKPINWLLRSEINKEYFFTNAKYIDTNEILNLNLDPVIVVENGILTDLTSRVSKKVMGFIPVEITFKNGSSKKILLKSKPKDEEVMKGLHFMASNFNADVADGLINYKSYLEYSDCHNKEIDVYEFLHSLNIKCIPELFGSHKNAEREIFVVMMECLDVEKFKLFNSENEPELWTTDDIISTIKSITEIHSLYLNTGSNKLPISVKKFDPINPLAFYKQLNLFNKGEYEEWDLQDEFENIEQEIKMLEKFNAIKHTPLTLVHNDFNPRNIGIRKDGTVCIYDWELAVLNVPQRDVVELLSFVLEENFAKEKMLDLFEYQRLQFNESTENRISKEAWLSDCRVVAFEYLISRVGFYLAGGTLMNYTFAKRIFNNTNLMLEYLKEFK